MRVLKRSLALLALAGWLAGVAAQPAGMHISQVADRAPDLAVFVSSPRSASPGAAASQAAASARFTVALGNSPLRVKAAQPWDKSEGIALVVAIDVSASLGDAGFKAVKHQVSSALSQLPPRSQVALLAIGSEVKTIQGFGPITSVTGTTLQSLVANAPETALYEGVLLAQELAARASPSQPLRRAVLVLTDGIDDSRRGVGREEALQKISKGDAPVFAMALAPQHPPAAQLEAIKSLAQIARASGGGFVQAAPAKASEGLSSLLAEALQSQLLTVDCSSCPRDGTLRTLQVSSQQGDVSATDSREIRLLALAASAAPSTAASAASAPAAASVAASGAKGNLMSLMVQPWTWIAVAVLLVVLVISMLWLKRRKAPRPEPLVVDSGVGEPEDWGRGHGGADETNSPRHADADQVSPLVEGAPTGTPLTLDVSGQGRLRLRVAREIVLGRSKSADVCMERDSEASSRHAVLYFEGSALMVRDLGSSNGTSLNGTTISRPEPVDDGDVILVGRTEVRVYLGRT